MKRKADGHQADRCNAGDTGRESIEAIQPVDRIGNANQPDHRG